ncbi:hypothetical protein QG37_04007 [Candidozyma auris]|uniref:Uncharacterized protein n=1 Tax=Candidozyma auris TaxID=498019 RepID=A0A0L0NYX0_CANAR|nr:hypothetical protein QG37_04007 [[Candida] auris]
MVGPSQYVRDLAIGKKESEKKERKCDVNNVFLAAGPLGLKRPFPPSFSMRHWAHFRLGAAM